VATAEPDYGIIQAYALAQESSQEEESSDSSDPRHYRTERRVAKESHELREDLFNMFK